MRNLIYVPFVSVSWCNPYANIYVCNFMNFLLAKSNNFASETELREQQVPISG